MPELIAKDPQAVLQALRDAESCMPGTPSPELAACPAQHYCALPGGGELCVYGLDRLAQTSTQAAVVEPPVPEAREITGLEVVSVAAVFIAGIAVGRYWPRSRKGGPAGKA